MVEFYKDLSQFYYVKTDGKIYEIAYSEFDHDTGLAGSSIEDVELPDEAERIERDSLPEPVEKEVERSIL